MTLTNSGPSTGNRRSRPAPVNQNWQRAGLVSAVIAAAAVTVSACGGGSGANLGTAALAANSAAAAGNGAAGPAGTAGDSATTPGSVPSVGASPATGSGTTVVVGGTAGNTTTVTVGPITSVTRMATASGFPTAPAAPSIGGGNATGSPAVVPPAAQAVSCPLPGPPSQAIPAGFEPVAAVRCVLTSFQPTEYRLEAAVSNLGPLLTALLAPSSTVGSFTAVPPCLLPAVNFSHLALVDANGKVIEPSIPMSVCGWPSEAVLASLAALTWMTVK